MDSVSHLMGKGRGVGGNRGHDGPGYYPGKYASERGNPKASRDGIEAIVMNEKGETIRTIASEIVGSASPRKDGFNYGTGWGSTDPLPPIYGEAVKLEAAWNKTVHEVQSIRWAITEAIRNVRLAETETEKRLAVSELAEVVIKTRGVLIRV